MLLVFYFILLYFILKNIAGDVLNRVYLRKLCCSVVEFLRLCWRSSDNFLSEYIGSPQQCFDFVYPSSQPISWRYTPNIGISIAINITNLSVKFNWMTVFTLSTEH